MKGGHLKYLTFICLLFLSACDWQVGGSAYRETPYAKANKKDIVINISEPESLDPQLTNGTNDILILKNLFERLVDTDENGNPIPALAESWEHRDYRVWTFYLRKDAHWSDGTPITAHDFVYAWRRLVDPQTSSPVVSALTDVWVLNAKEIVAGKKKVQELGVKALDDYTFEVTLEKSVPFFVIGIDHPALAALPKKSIQTYAKKWTRPQNMISSGAYRLKTWNISSNIEIVRNPYYWDDVHTKNEKIVLVPMNSQISDTVSYVSGNADISGGVVPELFARIKSHYPNELKVYPLACTYFYDVNLTRAPFNDKRVRLALSMTLPREIIVSKVLGQGQEVGYTLTPYFINHFTKLEPEWAKWSLEKRVAKAKQLLKEAGYSEQNPLKFEILYNTSETHKHIAVTASTEWAKQLGFVQVTLNNMEWKTYLDAMRLGNFSMLRRGGCAGCNDPSTFLLGNLSDSPDNHSGYNNPHYDKVIQDVFRADISDEQLKQQYIQAEKILLEDVALLVIHSHVGSRLVKTYVKGFKANQLETIKFNQLWLDYGKTNTEK
ncbi:MAG: oligopeptide ABC transporter substrate-binding protein OppA [Neisseriaceae bacterium]|nr:MAG: oligopeptide ABC transporter substrate-binding protein OppA [Neisseriaceae bacterium]